MAITVQLYTFAKKINSTARPSSAPSAYDCVLKEGCSIIYPAIGIDNGAAWNPSAYNYAHIAAFDRYYYVSDWSYSGGLWWASMTVDALATWRSAIYNTEEYVLRAAAAYDGAIIDTMFPAKVTYTRKQYGWNGANLTGSPWVNVLSSGVYIVGIINNDANAIGAVSYYAFTEAQFSNFKDYLLGSIDWTGYLPAVGQIDENLFKALFDPFQYIVSVKWFPFAYSQITGATLQNSIKVGWWEIQNISCYRFNVPFILITHTLKLYRHPQAASRGKYLNTAPFSIYRLHAPPFGVFDLDNTLIADATFSNAGECDVSTNIRVDLISGKAVLNLFVLPSEPQSQNINLLEIETLLSMDIQLAQIYNTNNLSKLSDSAIKGAASVISGIVSSKIGEPTGNSTRIPDYHKGILDAAAIGSLWLSQMCNNGSLSQFYLTFYIDSIHMTMTEDAYTDKGRPLCQERQLSTLAPGYVITAGSHVALAGTDYEIGAVNDALDGGVFLA